MLRIADMLDLICRKTAFYVRWLVLVMVLIQFLVVVARYVFGYNSIVASESIVYMHATLFMLGAAYTLQMDKHVRVDLFYSRITTTTQNYINLFGHTCLLVPSMLLLLVWTWPSVIQAWAVLEGPLSVGGIKGVFLLKSLIPVFCLMIMAQSLAISIRLLVKSTP